MTEIKKALKPEDSVTTNIISQNAEKESFILYTEQKEVIDNLTDEDAGKLFKGIFDYALGNEPQFNNLLKLVFIPIRQQLERNAKKYAEIKEKRRIAGAKGGKQKVANQANANFAKQNQANQAVNVHDNVHANVHDNVHVNDNNNVYLSKDKYKENNNTNSQKENLKKPTIEEIKNYCLERKNSINPSQFFDYYESKGWLIGKTPMKDWKAAIRTWEQNQSKNKNAKDTQDQTGDFDYDNTPYRAF